MNRPRQLEFRTLALLEALRAGRSLREADPLGATFRRWPPPTRATARLLAAHANTARGREVLWLVGVERDGKPVGANSAQFEAWQGTLQPFFDGLAPRLSILRVPVETGTNGKLPRSVVAILVESDRAPFVVRTTGTREVPWLDPETRRVQTAGRMELIRLLSPLQDLPQIETLEAELTFYKNTAASYSSKATYRWTLDGSIYLLPSGDQRLVVPLHRCQAALRSIQGNFASACKEVNFTADKNSPAIRLTESAMLIEGLGRVFIYCAGSTTQPEIPLDQPMHFSVDLVPVGCEQAASALTTLRPAQVAESNQAGRWNL